MTFVVQTDYKWIYKV